VIKKRGRGLLKRYERKMVESHVVKKNSREWRFVLSNVMDGRTILKIERLQNRKLWKNYEKYSRKLTEKRKLSIRDEKWVWHGTRQTSTDSVWKGNGFDMAYARVGGCIWFAQQNSYSMGGYQFQNPLTGMAEVFLAVVQCGDGNDVKIIRGNILNVYANAATYPAYKVSF